MDTLITSYFPKSTHKSHNGSAKKRRPSKDSELVTPTNATKRAKLAASSEQKKCTPKRPVKPTQAAVASSSKPAVPEVILIPLDGPRATIYSEECDPKTVPPPNVLHVPGSSWRSSVVPRERSIIPATPDQGPPASCISLSPIPFRALSTFNSEETVGSSQSQDDAGVEEAYGDAYNLSVIFTPKCGRPSVGNSAPDVFAKRDAITSPRIVNSSQSQYLSMSQVSPPHLQARATILIEDSIEIVPSSQSQEKELELSNVFPGPAWGASTRELIPEPASPLTQSYLSKELPVRRLGLFDKDKLPILHDDGRNNVTHPTSRARLNGQGPENLYQLAAPEHSSQAGYPSPLMHHRSPLSSPTRPHIPTSPILGSPSRTQDSAVSLTQYTQSVYSFPPEVKAFRNMFQGEESYPDDFPMSLRI